MVSCGMLACRQTRHVCPMMHTHDAHHAGVFCMKQAGDLAAK